MVLKEDKQLGTKENKAALEAKQVSVVDVTLEQTSYEGKKVVSLHCKHPDKEETIELRKVKTQDGDTLKVAGLWYTLDEDGNVSKSSGLGKLMAKKGVTSVNQLVGQTVDTIKNEQGFLVVKGYE